jgi:hypothetical protein
LLTIRHWLSLIFESVFPLFVSLKYQESDNKKKFLYKKKERNKRNHKKKKKEIHSINVTFLSP